MIYMEFLQNPLFVGGILPMIFFGMMDFSFRLYAKEIPFQNVFFYTSLGGCITMFILNFSLFGASFDQLQQFIELFSQQAIFAGILLGIIWTISISSMGFAYEKLNANAAQIVPIASSSGLLGALLGIFFLDEKISLLIFSLSSLCIIIGIIILSQAENNNSSVTISLKKSLLPILIGGFIPFFGFGALNILFKIFGELNAGILGIIMACTGMIISFLIQKIRKQKFIHKPILMNSGIFWALAVASLGYGFYPLLGNASTMLPIVGASPLISLFFVKIFLKENVNWNFVMLGAIIIICSLGALNYWG